MKLGASGKPKLLFLYAHLLHPERLREAGITGATGSCIPARVKGYCVRLEDGGCRARLARSGCPSGEAVGVICSASPDATRQLEEGAGRLKVVAEPLLQGLPPVEAEAAEVEEAGDCGEAVSVLAEALCFWDSSLKGFKDLYLKGLAGGDVKLEC